VITLKPSQANSYLEVSNTDDLTTLATHNGYLRVGLGSEADNLTSDNDLLVTGSVEIDGDLYVAGEVLAPKLTAAIKEQIKTSLPLESAKVYWQSPQITTILKVI
jgi:hypothetical protein